MGKPAMFSKLVSTVIVLIFSNIVHCEPPVRSSGGWGQQQQQNSGGYSQSGTYSSGYSNSMAGYSGGQSSGGWGQSQPQTQSSTGGWGQSQPQVQSSSGGWGQSQSQVQSSGNGGSGWGSSGQSQMKGQGNNGWGPQLNLELDTANLKVENLNPAKIFRSIIGIPRKIINFIRESGLYLLFIPLIIILPLMLLAFNAGRTLGGLGWGWGWGRSLTSTVESGIVGYLKSPVWQKIGETLMDEKVFERIMKSLEEFNKDW